MDYIPSAKNASRFIDRFNCCKPKEEEKSLFDDEVDSPQRCPTLRYVVQHPVTTGIELATFSACFLQLLTTKIMGGPGCDLSAMAAISSTAMKVTIPFLVGSGAAFVGSTYLQHSDTKRIINKAGGEAYLIEDEYFGGSEDEEPEINWRPQKNEGLEIKRARSDAIVDLDDNPLLDNEKDNDPIILNSREYEEDVHDIIPHKNAAPSCQFLRDACKNPIVMSVEALTGGVLVELLLWPTILDLFNCFTGNGPVGSNAMKYTCVGVLIGVVVLYGFGARFWSTERNQQENKLMKIIDFEKKRASVLVFRRGTSDDEMKTGRSTYQFDQSYRNDPSPRLADHDSDDFRLHVRFGAESPNVGYAPYSSNDSKGVESSSGPSSNNEHNSSSSESDVDGENNTSKSESDVDSDGKRL
jgi:hypothetical protein